MSGAVQLDARGSLATNPWPLVPGEHSFPAALDDCHGDHFVIVNRR